MVTQLTSHEMSRPVKQNTISLSREKYYNTILDEQNTTARRWLICIRQYTNLS